MDIGLQASPNQRKIAFSIRQQSHWAIWRKALIGNIVVWQLGALLLLAHRARTLWSLL
jgi:hypothetical protein